MIASCLRICPFARQALPEPLARARTEAGPMPNGGGDAAWAGPGRRPAGRAVAKPASPPLPESPLPSNYVSHAATLDFCPFFLPWSLLTRTPLNAPDPSFRPPVKVQSDSGRARGCRSKVLLSPPWLRLSPRTPRRCAEPRAQSRSRGGPRKAAICDHVRRGRPRPECGPLSYEPKNHFLAENVRQRVFCSSW